MRCLDYEIKLFDQNGTSLGVINDYSTFELTRIKNDIGTFNIVLPESNYDYESFLFDYRVEVYRKNKLVGDTVWLLQRKEKVLNSACDTEIVLTFADTIDIIRRRYNTWYACDAPQCFSTMEGAADDIMKLLMQYNFGNLVEPDLDPITYPFVPLNMSPMTVQDGDDILTPAVTDTYNAIYNTHETARQMPINIEGFRGNGIIITQEFSFINVLDALQDVASGSYADKRENLIHNVWFDIIYSPATLNSPATFKFDTWVGSRGQNNINKVYVGPDYNNLTGVTYIEDWSSRGDIAYVLTDSELTGQTIGSAYLNPIQNAYFYNLPFGPIELVTDYPSQTDDITPNQNLLEGEGLVILGSSANTRSLDGEIINSGNFDFMTHYNYGDILTLSWGTSKENVEISEFTLSVNEDGIETITVPLNLL